MSSHPISKSSTLRGLKFEDEIVVTRVSTSIPIKTWKVVPSNPMKKNSFEDKTFNSMVTFRLKTENKFACIGDQFQIEITEADVNEVHKPIHKKLKKRKIKKNKKVRKMQRYYITDSIEATPSVNELEVKRCNKCFVKHFPSLPKFCRWAEEHADRMKKKSMINNSTGSKKIEFSSNFIEMIQTRINSIEEQINPKCISSHSIKNPKDKKIKIGQDKLSKLRNRKLEDKINMTENANDLFGCYPSQNNNIDKCSENENLELYQHFDGCNDVNIAEDEDSITQIDGCNYDVIDEDKDFISQMNDSNDVSNCENFLIPQFDGADDIIETNYLIPQFDGADDIIEDNDLIPQIDGNSREDDGNIQHKDVYAINSEMDEVICLINFFRSCSFLWTNAKIHPFCKSESLTDDCFFCYLRSSCLKLNLPRSKGPRSVKLIEFISQLPQYETEIKWNWKDNFEKIDEFIEKTLMMLNRREKMINSYLKCEQCGIKKTNQ